MIQFRSFLSKNLTRIGLDFVPVGVPVMWVTSISFMSRHFFLQSSAVSLPSSGTLNTCKFQRLEFVHFGHFALSAFSLAVAYVH